MAKSTKTTRLQKMLKRSIPEVRVPISSEMYLPNHSGDHTAGIIRRTPSKDTDISSKKYVDDQISGAGHVLRAGDTMTGDLIIESNTNSGLIIRTTDTTDPSLHFVSTNSAHDFDIHLDESASNDALILEGHTASADTEILITSLTGQAGLFHLKAGDNEAHFKMDASGDLEILNENQDKDIVFVYTHSAETHNITFSAEDDKIKHSTGTFDFDDDNIITTGTLTAGSTTITALDVNGNSQFDGTITVGIDDTGHDVKFFGATTGKFMLWDESADELFLSNDTKISMRGSTIHSPSTATLSYTVTGLGSKHQWLSGANSLMVADGIFGIIINEGGISSFDFRVESDTNSHMLFVDSGAQTIGINKSGPNTNASMEFGGIKPILLPRLTTTQRDAVTAVDGMLIYNTTTNATEAYENGVWVDL